MNENEYRCGTELGFIVGKFVQAILDIIASIMIAKSNVGAIWKVIAILATNIHSVDTMKFTMNRAYKFAEKYSVD